MQSWASITTTNQAQAYIAAELAEAQQYCPAAVADYKTAFAAAASMLLMDWGSAKPTVEAALMQARSTWKANNCTKATVTGTPITLTAPPDNPNDDGGWADQMNASVMGGDGGSVWLLAALGGVAIWLLYGKKGKGGKRSGGRKHGKTTKTTKRRAAAPRRRR